MIRFPKIRLILGGCLLLVLFSSCRPKGVLSRKEMADVLIDIHLAEAAVSEVSAPIPEEWTRGLDKESFKDMAYRSVLRKHHLSQESFYYSVSWYCRHMNLYEKIYMDVQNRLDDFKAAIDEGKFDRSTNSSKYGMDSTKIRSLYTFGTFRRDTVVLHQLYRSSNVLPSSSSWYSKQWMYQIQKDTARIILYPQVSVPAVPNMSHLDSLQAKTDSLMKQKNLAQPLVMSNTVLAPGGRRLPTRNFREIPKSEQIRKRFQQRALEQERLKRLEMQQKRSVQAPPSK
ncbi:MAG TPA: DUF4296 domain-containing protein [Bacteroidales bacterium]|nr:DUF4296 domain-containing protein [Bacteroidales bacterium]